MYQTLECHNSECSPVGADTSVIIQYLLYFHGCPMCIFISCYLVIQGNLNIIKYLCVVRSFDSCVGFFPCIDLFPGRVMPRKFIEGSSHDFVRESYASSYFFPNCLFSFIVLMLFPSFLLLCDVPPSCLPHTTYVIFCSMLYIFHLE